MADLYSGNLNEGKVDTASSTTLSDSLRIVKSRKAMVVVQFEELAAWAKKSPDEFYENIYKLKGWPWPGMQKN